MSRAKIIWTMVAALLVCGDCLFVAAVGEVWVRLFVPVKNVCWQFDDKFGPRLCPNQERISYVEHGYSNTLITNSIGAHDIERNIEKIPGTFRIHIYGDSMIVGVGIQISETIPAVVERRLNTVGAGYPIEVFNMGWMDSTTSQITHYEAFGRRYRPDMVVSTFMDDLPDNLAEVHRRPHQSHYRLDDDGELVFVPLVPKDTDTLWEWVKRTSRLYRLLANKLFESKIYYEVTRYWRALGIRRSAVDSGIEASEGESALSPRQRLLIEKGWPLTLELFERFRDTVERAGAQFVIADGRSLYDENAGTVYSNRDFERFCVAKNIHYVSTYEVLDRLEAADPSEGYFLDDGHPTALGNEILGNALAEQLARFLPQNSSFEGTRRD